MSALTPDQMWQAVLNDDAAYDGKFFVAVRTTGVYCRPSCKARLPKRDNVRFYPNAEAARAAGYRPCKLCRPDADGDARAAQMEAIARYIESQAPEQTITLDTLAAEFHLSPTHLQRTFKAVIGVSPRQYAAAVRLRLFKAGLQDDQRVTDAMLAAGYTSTSRLYEQTARQLGMRPSEYQKGGLMQISFATAPCPLGVLLVAATARGICAVRLGDDPEALRRSLADEFPSATLSESPSDMLPLIEPILRHLSGDLPHLDLPLDIQATAFQQQVWAALRQIPYGETRTYAQVAEAIHQPNAARAVGNACASNPAALVIPCHRVVKADGSAGNYRWGVGRKERLLKMEREAAVLSGIEPNPANN